MYTNLTITFCKGSIEEHSRFFKSRYFKPLLLISAFFYVKSPEIPNVLYGSLRTQRQRGERRASPNLNKSLSMRVCAFPVRNKSCSGYLYDVHGASAMRQWT
ncbi:hypothetical protein ABEB36_013169 [Hypothenemus hampei]|uniref:Uncharacterized protein n=1 Tax=Hypothenemus hampei TaxID=57062 RepID=A0ABD1E725_HYPHA